MNINNQILQPLTFTGTAYLALDRHPDLLSQVRAGLERYGLHYGGSRRAPHAPDVYIEAEAWLAELTGAPAALVASSGTVAGQLVVRQLATNGYHLVQDAAAHPALHWPTSVRATPDDLPAVLERELAGHDRLAVLLESVDPLKISRPDWSFLAAFADKSELTVVVDDSHGIGLFGEQGGGSWRALREAWPGRLIVTASLGKALSLPAGVILADEDTIKEIAASAIFGGASPPSPAFLHALLHAGHLIELQRLRLREKIDFLRQHLPPEPAWSSLPDYPVFYTPEQRVAPFLAEQGITISQFAYPGPADEVITRIVLNAAHGERDLERLVESLRQWRRL